MKVSSSLFGTILVAAITVTAGSAQAAHRHTRHVPAHRRAIQRQCIPLPNVSTPVTQVPDDPNDYCEPPWVNDQTVYITCSPRLTRLNAYSQCHFECGPAHDTGSASGLCTNQCLARFCQYGR